MFKIQCEIKSKMTAYVWAISGYGVRASAPFWHTRLVRPVARGGANRCNCTPPLDARSAWQAMNIVHLIVIAVQSTCTHINEICHAVVCMYILQVCM